MGLIQPCLVMFWPLVGPKYITICHYLVLLRNIHLPNRLFFEPEFKNGI